MTSRRNGAFPLEDDPQWYKDAVIYELHVKSFHDSDGDGIGDFRGLTQKLDYLQDLGVTAIWLLPFYPSPLRDDGYDIADYRTINPTFGTLQDFRSFLNAAHARGIRVITELVVNHTSDQHPWFQQARDFSRRSRYHDFYVWSDRPDKYLDARIIFKDFEVSNWTLDPVAQRYYWHRFYHHQPDLNFENPAVSREIFRVMDFWLGMGVDGMRLDAVPYLYEREGTNCENLPETHAFLKELRRHVDKKHRNRMLLAEANQWPEDAVAYFGEGDECHMSFHFPVMPRLFMAVQMEDRFPIVDILRQTPTIPDTAQWALFLRNHDELTLEMVTDEERDYMYRTYASDPSARINLGIRRRLAPLVGNDRRVIELLNGLLFSLPGTPIVYYGDEIGMGDNHYLGDRNGVRTPMQWSADRNAGFSRANPQRLFAPVIIDPGHHYEAVNVEAQQSNPNMLLWWMKRLISLRKQYKVFGRGTLEFLYPDNPKVIAFLRQHEGETVMVVANLSRYAQGVQLDLSAFQGSVPVEMFGHAPFPPVTEGPYTVTLGPHAFYWFLLEPTKPSPENLTSLSPKEKTPVLTVRARWESVFDGQARPIMASVLLDYVRGRRWFGGKSKEITGAEITDAVPLQTRATDVYLSLLTITYTEGEPDVYTMLVGFEPGDRAASLAEQFPQAVIGEIRSRTSGGDEGLLFDAMVDPDFHVLLLDAITRRRSFESGTSEVFTTTTRAFRQLRGLVAEPLKTSVLGVEQSNTSVVYGERLILKLFRRAGQGVNPDLEVGRFLTERARFPHTASVAGAVEYRPRRNVEPTTIAVLQGYVENEGDAWRYTLDALDKYFERVLAHPELNDPEQLGVHPLDLNPEDMGEALEEAMGSYILSAAQLGERTAELHLALASAGPGDPAFTPEPFSTMYQRSVYAAMRAQTTQVLQALSRGLRTLPEEVREDARRVVGLENEILQRFEALRRRRIQSLRIRIHGDYHLGQVLFTGRDFVIIDFEGEPTRAVSERKLKRSPIRDVAGMVRSFDYAAQAALTGQGGVGIRPEDVNALTPWAEAWTQWVSATYLRAYLEVAGETDLVPQDDDDLRVLFDAQVLYKAMYEIAYEMNNRPTWLSVPLRGVLRLVGE